MSSFCIFFNTKDCNATSISFSLCEEKVILKGDEGRNIGTRGDIQIFWNMIVEAIFPFANQIIDWFFNCWKVLEFSLESHKWQANHIPIICWIDKTNKSFKEIAIRHFFAQLFCEFTCIDFHRNRFRAMSFHRYFRPSSFSQFTWAECKFTIFYFICISIHQHFQGTIGI